MRVRVRVLCCGGVLAFPLCAPAYRVERALAVISLFPFLALSLVSKLPCTLYYAAVLLSGINQRAMFGLQRRPLRYATRLRCCRSAALTSVRSRESNRIATNMMHLKVTRSCAYRINLWQQESTRP